MTWSSTRSCGVLALATVCCLLPFSGRPFHVDDPLFVWAAHNIAKHPLDPYGFQITWDAVPQRMAEITQNPPLASYYAVLIGSVFGWSERALHLGFLLIAVMLVVGVWRLARKFTEFPMLAALACLLTPGFLVSACSVMCDVMMLMLWVWAIIFWIEGLERRIPFALATAAFVIGLAALTKYFAVSLIPLLAAYTWLRVRRFVGWAPYLVIPCAMLLCYQLWSEKLYGHGLLTSAARFSVQQHAYLAGPWPTMVLIGLSFAGGCTLIALAFAPLLWSRFVFGIALLGAVLRTFAKARGWLGPGLQVIGGPEIQRTWLLVDVELTICLMAGILLVWITFSDFDYQNADSWLLVLWVVGTLVFTCFINYTVNARSILPLIPAVSILVVRRLEKKRHVHAKRVWIAGALCFSGMVSLIVASGDTALASSQRRAAEMSLQKSGTRTGSLWFEGHWGFQYYMERDGAKPLNMEDPKAGAGDYVVLPHSNVNLKAVPALDIATKQDFELNPEGWASTIDPWHRAGFYSSYWGPLPYYVGRPPAERYTIVQLANPLTWRK